MKKTIRTFNFTFAIVILTIISTSAQISEEDRKVSAIVESYEKALNANNVEGIIQLFTEDGVLILQGAPTQIGKESARNFFTSLFKMLDFDLKFEIDEVVIMSQEWAFIRTTTSGTVSILSNKSSNPGNGHELFIVKKQADGNWRIARYSGSSSK